MELGFWLIYKKISKVFGLGKITNFPSLDNRYNGIYKRKKNLFICNLLKLKNFVF